MLRHRGIYWFSWLTAAAFVAMLVSGMISGPGPDPHPEDYIAFGVVGVGSVLVALRVTRLRMELSGAGVTIVKLVTTEYAAWRDVKDVTVDRLGLHIERDDGQVVTAGSMGKAAFGSLSAGADAWVREIRSRARAARS